MIATRRLFFWGRKMELELRVHVIRPEQPERAVPTSTAERIAEQADARRGADQRRTDWQRMWLEQGIHS